MIRDCLVKTKQSIHSSTEDRRYKGKMFFPEKKHFLMVFLNAMQLVDGDAMQGDWGECHTRLLIGPDEARGSEVSNKRGKVGCGSVVLLK